MKKTLSLILAVLLAVSLLAGCQQAGVAPTQAPTGTPTQEPTAEPTQEPTQPPIQAAVLQVGFGRVDISPKTPVSLTGYGDADTRISEGTDVPLMSTCIAFTGEDGNTLLLFYNDLCTSETTTTDACRKAVSEATGISVDNIMSAATHIHSAPSLGLNSKYPGTAEYSSTLPQKMVEAAQAALADRKEAKMYITTVATENMNFIRHYNMKDGTVSGDNFGSKASGYASHVGEPDRDLQLIKFTREGKKDIILANFATHPHKQGIDALYNYAHSDIVGVMRQELEAKKDCLFAYFTGAGGNVNPMSKFPWEKIYKDFRDQGAAMAQYAFDAYDSFTEVKTGNVKVQKTIYIAQPKESGKTVPNILMYAFSIGDVAFVCAPYEMFSENGVQIKEGSPFKMTFVSTYTNQHVKYIPSEAGFEYPGVGYSYEGRVCQYEKGTAEKLVAKYAEMLNMLDASQR